MRAAKLQEEAPVERAAPTPQDLLRLLLCQLTSTELRSVSAGEDESTNHAEEIILDVDVDGARYLVLRLPQATRQRSVLSPREQEIVRMVSQGHPNKIIADVLGISSWTVCTHMRRIFAKLGVTSRAAMVARLLEAGTRCMARNKGDTLC
ncbi:MAG TPA: LuxR C-terminal-related transcriptional regulator [Bryobacteraceae bacterium]|jgi:DNA-binding CsgD family transcriptional regulator|nr:LuxR C-terminal-related transcriptional regulator [Bryobacteraceae bacterium]